MTTMFVLFQGASEMPKWSVICFIAGIVIWLFGLFFGWRYTGSPNPNAVWAGRGVDIGTMLVILAIALRTIFGV